MSQKTSRALFTSARERRLWLLALAVVVAIYAVLALARPLPDGVLASRTIEQLMFWSAMAVFASVFVVSLTTSLSRIALITRAGMVLGIGAVYFMAFLRFSSAAERTHLVEYSVVALLVLEALRERARNDRQVPRPPLLAFVLTATVGVFDECVQLFMPNRVFDPVDIAFNCGAAGAAVLATLALSWVRRQFGRSGS